MHHLGSDDVGEGCGVMGTVRRGPVSPTARRTIGVLSPVVGGFYFGALIAGVARAARAAGQRVVAVQTYPAGLDRERYPEESILDAPVALGAVDGLVVVGKALRSDRLASVQQWGLPVVLVSEEPQSADDAVVLPDYVRVGETAVSLLLSRMRGDEVPGGEYRAASTLVLRESCGCTEAVQSASATSAGT